MMDRFCKGKEMEERGFLIQGTADKEGQYSFLRTECGTTLYGHLGTVSKRNHTLCPNCGKVIVLEEGEAE